MTRAPWLLAWRLQRVELAVLIGGALILAAAMALVAWQTAVTNDRLSACYGASRGVPLSDACRSAVDWGNLLTALGEILPGAATVAPFIIGLLLGAPLVAREIEKRTAPIAWSLSPSRLRWLAGRTVPLVIAISLALLLLGQAADILEAARFPDGRGFANYGSHGPLIAARGLAIFGIGLAVGLLVGRVLPAILVAGFLAAAVFGAIEYGRAELMRAEATWLEGTYDGSIAMVYGSAYRSDATGEHFTDQEVYEAYPEVFGPQGDGIPPGMTQLLLATPTDRYPAFVARESGALLLVAVVAGAVAVAVVRVRRPE